MSSNKVDDTKTENNVGDVKLSGALELFGSSWKVVKNNPRVFAVLSIPVLLSMLSSLRDTGSSFDANSFTINFLGGHTGASFFGLFSGIMLLGIAYVILNIILATMQCVAELRGAEGRQLTLSDVWVEAKPNILPILGISFIVALIVVCGIILLIIPGLIAFRRYIFAPYVLIDKKVGIKESLDISAKMTKPHSWSIYRILFVMGTIQLLGSVPFVGTIASTLLGIAYSVALAIKYLEIKKVSVTQP